MGKVYKGAFPIYFMEGYRDIHETDKDISFYLEKIKNSDMSDYQKDNILKFVKDLKIGKTGKKVKSRRIASYLQWLIKLNEILKKDLDKITEQEGEKFYTDLQDNKITKLHGISYSQATKDLIVRTLKKYYSYCNGKDTEKEMKKYKTIVGWMKEDYKKSDKQAITLEQLNKILKAEEEIRNKCLIAFLFDSGARIEEALNIRISDITLHKKEKGEQYYIVHLKGTKTELADRKIALPLCSKELTAWLKHHPTKGDNDYLFPLQYDNCRKIIAIATKKALGFTLSPHELRHSSATYYIQQFGAENIGGFYYRYGWKFGSKEANGYIKEHLFGGEIGQQKVVKVVESGKLEALENENADLREKYDIIFKMVNELKNKRDRRTK